MKSTIAVFIHNPQCETECALGMVEGLVNDFNIRTFGIDELNIDFLKTVDAVAFPGGMGNADDFYDIFTEDHIDAIHTFIGVYNGKYLGICMGAYWAGIDYFDVAVDLTIGQYIERPTSDIDYEGPTVANVIWNGSSETMYFYDGCAIIGDDNMDIVAKYANGDAMAIIQGNIGIIGCHPEAQQWWYDGIEDNYKHNYYRYHHKELMADLVKELLDNE
jgi:glutamine amidotransferase-like uncharacterized protein